MKYLILPKKFPRAVLVWCLFGIIATAVFCASISVGLRPTLAANSGTFGSNNNFAILASTYTNTVGGTTINGDLGYTTGPAFAPTVNGTTHVANGTYTQGGTDQNILLTNLNAQPCDFNFGSPTDLSTLPQPLLPGVYCINGATSIGVGGITLSGSGTYIFRVVGALSTVANSAVTLQGGAFACDVFWTPSAATTLGANSTFLGTIIDNAGVTIGSLVTITGRALAFGGTVSTNADTISVASCPAPVSPASSNSSRNGGAAPMTGGGNSLGEGYFDSQGLFHSTAHITFMTGASTTITSTTTPALPFNATSNTNITPPFIPGFPHTGFPPRKI